MSTKKCITPAAIARLRPGETLRDAVCPGLRVEANLTGASSWRYLRKARDGKIIKRTLGSVATFDVAVAREWAREINVVVERGGNPDVVAAALADAESREQARLAMTGKAAWELYISALEGEGNHAPHTLRMKRCRFENDILPVVGDKPLSEIEHDDLWAIAEHKIKKGFGSASNHLVADIKVFFRWCMTYGRTATGLRRNPSVDLIKLSKDRSRRRTFNLMELRLFLRAIANSEDDFCRRLFILLMLSGQRLSNVLWARPVQWCSELDAWEIERTKNDEPNVVPLAPWGKALLKGGGENWVFPSTRGDGPRLGHIVVLSRGLRTSMQELAPPGFAVEHWTPHDLRRVIRTHMSRLRVKREIAERVLAHKLGGVEAIYDRYEYLDEKREALAVWEADVIRIATEEGLADRLGIPVSRRSPLETG